MKNCGRIRTVCVAAAVLAALGVLLWLLHPLAPLLLYGSLAIQAPIIWVLGRKNFSAGYSRRTQENRLRYLESGDAATWLAAEEREAAGRGFAYWPRRAKALNALARGEALAALERRNEAAMALADVDEALLDAQGLRRFEETVAAIRGGVQALH